MSTSVTVHLSVLDRCEVVYVDHGSNPPAITPRADFNRLFVERGGKVYFGYRNVDNVPRSTRLLTLPGATAVLTTLGTAAIVP